MATSPFLKAEWRKLAIANYAIDSTVLQRYLPHKTELDTWNGQCYVSLVGFMFLNTKLKGFAIPFHQHFEEVNLRFYVRYKHQNEWKRGVTFIKEIVPRHALTFVANNIYKEKYVTLPMQHSWISRDNILEVEYKWKKGDWNSFRVLAGSAAKPLLENSKTEFITEHYWGYVQRGPQKTSEYQVEHPRWSIYDVLDHKINVDFGKVYGDEFKWLGENNPESVMLAEGSEIVVRGATILK